MAASLAKWAGFVKLSHTVFALPFALAAMVVAARATGDQVAPSESKWHNRGVPNAIDLAFPAMDISATRIREAIEQGRSISQWVHPNVNDYIQHHHLYRQTR